MRAYFKSKSKCRWIIDTETWIELEVKTKSFLKYVLSKLWEPDYKGILLGFDQNFKYLKNIKIYDQHKQKTMEVTIFWIGSMWK